MNTGFINVNKPSGVSSGYVVNRIKKLTGMPCGHMGTLDPLASGVLPVGVGNATRMFSYFLEKEKEYIADFRFGVSSDTLDSTGELSFENPYIPTEEELLAALPAQIGDISQMPPKYSAKSVNGRRGYALARAGVEFELEPKLVHIQNIELLEKKSSDTFSFRIRCGAGTYIRSIARDLAAACGADGIMTALFRTQSGKFLSDDAVALETLTKENIFDFLQPTKNFLDYPPIEIENPHIFNGLPQFVKEEDGLYTIDRDGELYGIVEVAAHRAKIRTKLC